MDSFEKTGNSLITINDIHFVQVNSMEMNRDGCFFCETGEKEINEISARLNCSRDKTAKVCKNVVDAPVHYSQPILLQHFPTYRQSDVPCDEHDSPLIELYRENWEVLSKSATDFLKSVINPRVAFSGHSHNYCRIKGRLGVYEYTLASFSWRNKNNPSFLLVSLVNRLESPGVLTKFFPNVAGIVQPNRVRSGEMRHAIRINYGKDIHFAGLDVLRIGRL